MWNNRLRPNYIVKNDDEILRKIVLRGKSKVYRPDCYAKDHYPR